MYGGIVLAYVGLAVAQGNTTGVAVFGAQVVGYVWKTLAEERFLAAELGSAYRRYRERVRWRLVPWIW
jgi:protein-S-isoprenylcysteine O-methyltransferase Ste14